MRKNSTAAGGMAAVGVDTDLWCRYDAVLLTYAMCYTGYVGSALLCGTRTSQPPMLWVGGIFVHGFTSPP